MLYIDLLHAKAIDSVWKTGIRDYAFIRSIYSELQERAVDKAKYSYKKLERSLKSLKIKLYQLKSSANILVLNTTT